MTQLFQHWQEYHTLLIVVGLFLTIFFWKNGPFIKECLSEFNVKANSMRGSSRRLGAFMFVLTLCMCILYIVLKNGKMELWEGMLLFFGILFSWGLVTFDQAGSFMNKFMGRGGSEPSKTPANTNENTES